MTELKAPTNWPTNFPCDETNAAEDPDELQDDEIHDVLLQICIQRAGREHWAGSWSVGYLNGERTLWEYFDARAFITHLR